MTSTKDKHIIFFLRDKCKRLEKRISWLDDEIIRLNEVVRKLKRKKGIARKGMGRLDFHKDEDNGED